MTRALFACGKRWYKGVYSPAGVRRLTGAGPYKISSPPSTISVMRLMTLDETSDLSTIRP